MNASRTWLQVATLLIVLAQFACRPQVAVEVTEQELSSEQGVSQMEVKSPAFANGAKIPAKFTGVGDDVSPPIVWSTPPEGTKTIALICDDPDAPSREHPRPEGPWVHWVIYNIPASVQSLPEAIPRRADVANLDGAKQGINDFPNDNIGYRGPMPPPGSGPHRYFFKVYALDCELDLPPARANKASLLAAMKGHVVAEGKLMGIFERR